MAKKRKSNDQLVEEMRALLTHDFELENTSQERGLTMSKPWRNNAWKLLNEMDRRLNPTKYLKDGQKK